MWKVGFVQVTVQSISFRNLYILQNTKQLRHCCKESLSCSSKKRYSLLLKGDANGLEKTREPFEEGNSELYFGQKLNINSKDQRKSYLDFIANFCDETEVGAILDALFEKKEFQEALSVLSYVHSNKLSLPSHILKSAVDAAIKERNITLLYQVLVWLKRTGLARNFDSRRVSLPNLTDFRFDSSSFNKVVSKNISIVLQQNASTMKSGRPSFPSGPVISDTLFGLCFLGFLGVGLSMELINPLILHHEDWEPTMFLLLIFFGLAADRYMGSGKVYRSVERGLRRIFTDDAVRTSRCEAAFLLSGYVLGIPYLFFQPNGDALIRHHRTLLELVDHTENSSFDNSKLLRNDREGEILYKYLVWMCSGLAAESAIDGLFFEIDPDKIWRFVDKLDASMWKLFGCRAEEDRKDCKRHLLESAYNDAEQILNIFRKEHLFLADKMLSGASAGECIVSLERVL